MHTKELGVVFWNVPSDILRVPEIVCVLHVHAHLPQVHE